MFYGGDLTVTIAQTGRKIGLIDQVRPGGDVLDRTEVAATKDNTGIRWRGAEHHHHLTTRM